MNKTILTIAFLSLSTLTQAGSGTQITVDCMVFPSQEKCSMVLDASEVNGDVSLAEKVGCKSAPYDLVLENGGEYGGISILMKKEKKTIFGKLKNKTIMSGEIWARAGVRSSVSLSRTMNGSGMSCSVKSE